MRKGGKGAVRLPKILVLIKTAWGHTIAARETVPPVIGSYLQDRLVGLAALSQSSKRFSLVKLNVCTRPPSPRAMHGTTAARLDVRLEHPASAPDATLPKRRGHVQIVVVGRSRDGAHI